MRKRLEKLKTHSFKIPPDLIKEIKATAAILGISMGDLLIRAFRAYLDEIKKEKEKQGGI
jgi:hypothetical protein